MRTIATLFFLIFKSTFVAELHEGIRNAIPSIAQCLKDEDEDVPMSMPNVRNE